MYGGIKWSINVCMCTPEDVFHYSHHTYNIVSSHNNTISSLCITMSSQFDFKRHENGTVRNPLYTRNTQSYFVTQKIVFQNNASVPYYILQRFPQIKMHYGIWTHYPLICSHLQSILVLTLNFNGGITVHTIYVKSIPITSTNMLIRIVHINLLDQFLLTIQSSYTK